MHSKWNVPLSIQTLHPYVPGKPIEELQRELGLAEVIKLASNENPLGPSPRALSAIQKSQSKLHFYPDANQFELKQALSEFWQIAQNEFLPTNGSNEAITLLIRTFCQPGDAIVTSENAFIAYPICAQAHGVEVVAPAMTSDFRFDLEALAQATEEHENVRLVFIANPNNPTGTFVTQDELEKFCLRVSKIKSRDVLIVLDDAYWGYATHADFPDPLKFYKKYENVVVLRTFSKIYGLAGLRVGYAIARPEILDFVNRIREPFNVNFLAQEAACAALKDQDFVKASFEVNQEGKKFLEKNFQILKVFYCPTEGNFFLIDLKTLSAHSFNQFALQKGVILRPIMNQGLQKGRLRVSIGTQSQNKKFIDVLNLFLKEN